MAEYLDKQGLTTLVTNIKNKIAKDLDARITTTQVTQIATNKANIATNTTNIATNTNKIANLEATIKTGVTFKGKVTDFPANPQNGWLIIKDTKEWIYEGTSKTWIELGDEGSHLTQATANSLYVPLTRTIAGKALNANVSADDMRTALNVADGATRVTKETVTGWGFTDKEGTVTGIKIGSLTMTPTPTSNGVVDIGEVVHKSDLADYVKYASDGSLNLGNKTIKFPMDVGPATAELNRSSLEFVGSLTSSTNYRNGYITVKTSNSNIQDIYLPFADTGDVSNPNIIALQGDIPEITAITDTEINNLFK